MLLFILVYLLDTRNKISSIYTLLKWLTNKAIHYSINKRRNFSNFNINIKQTVNIKRLDTV